MARSDDNRARRWQGLGLALGGLLVVAGGIWAGLDPFTACAAGLGLGGLVLLVPGRRRTRGGGEAADLGCSFPPSSHAPPPSGRREGAGLTASSARAGERVQPFEFALCVERHQDLVRVQRLTQRALIETHRVLTDPEPFSVVEEMGDFGVTLRVCGWVGSGDDPGRTRSESIREVQLALGSAGVRMAGRGPAQWTTDS